MVIWYSSFKCCLLVENVQIASSYTLSHFSSYQLGPLIITPTFQSNHRLPVLGYMLYWTLRTDWLIDCSLAWLIVVMLHLEMLTVILFSYCVSMTLQQSTEVKYKWLFNVCQIELDHFTSSPVTYCDTSSNPCYHCGNTDRAAFVAKLHCGNPRIKQAEPTILASPHLLVCKRKGPEGHIALARSLLWRRVRGNPDLEYNWVCGLCHLLSLWLNNRQTWLFWPSPKVDPGAFSGQRQRWKTRRGPCVAVMHCWEILGVSRSVKCDFMSVLLIYPRIFFCVFIANHLLVGFVSVLLYSSICSCMLLCFGLVVSTCQVIG